MKAYSPVNRTGSPSSGLFTKSNLTQVEYNTKHAHFYNHKTYKHNTIVTPFRIAFVKKMANKLGDAGTIWHFGLAFQYQIKKIKKKNGQKQSQNKITKCILIKANIPAIWRHMLHILPTKIAIS